MAPNDSLRNGSLLYNLLDKIIYREDFDFEPGFTPIDFDQAEVAVPTGLNRQVIRLTENVAIVLTILPPDFERCLMIRGEESLSTNELRPYSDPHPSNISLEEARSLIRIFFAEGLILSNEAIDNRQFIEDRFTELLLRYCEQTWEEHGLV